MATFTVTNTGSTGLGSLRSAVDQANAAAGADVIVFAPSVSGTIQLTNVAGIGTGGLQVTDALTIAGPGASKLTIQAAAGSEIINVNVGNAGVDPLADVAVSGLTLSGVNGGPAAILVLDDNLYLSGVTLSGNVADPAAPSAGALNMFAGFSSRAVLTIDNSTVSGNTGALGAIAIQGDIDVLVRRSTISGNSGDMTGAGPGGGLPIAGGLVFLGANGTFTLDASTVSGNTVGVDGAGGLFVFTGGALTVSGSTISGNTGGVGGASLFSLDTMVVNTTIANNTGTASVGGLAADGAVTNVIRNSTLYNNTIDVSVVNGVDAFLANFDALIQNSVVYSAGGSPDIGSNGAQITADYSLLGDYLSICGCFPAILGVYDITGAAPLLGPLANNGGPVQTMLPLAGSPLINRGSIAVIPYGPYDARGLARLSGGQIDIGAVEVQFAAPQPDAPPSQGPAVLGQFSNLARFQTYGSFPALPATVTTPTGQVLPHPFLAQLAAIQTIVQKVDAGLLTRKAALDLMVDLADSTTSVATLSYQFFTGRIPTKEGLDYLVSSPENASDLNDGFYAGMSLENRYINFAVNLGKAGAGRAAFEAQYGALSLTDAAAKAYGEIFGPPPAGKIADILTPDRIAYFNSLGGDALGSLGGDALGAKAAMVGWLLAESAKSDVGRYAVMNENFLYDLADGVAAYGADLSIYLNAGPRALGLVGVAGEF